MYISLSLSPNLTSLLFFFNNSHFSSYFENSFGGLRHERHKRRETRRNGDGEERKLGSCLDSSQITRAWVGWGLALSPPFSPQLQVRRVRAPPLLVPFSAFVSREEFESSDKRRHKMELVQRQGKRHPASRVGNLRDRGDGDGKKKKKKKNQRKQRWSFRFKTREDTRARYLDRQ
ncbi:hypothetical protein HID58_060103, partial [Brassica napus]